MDSTLKMPEGTDLDLEVAFVSGNVDLQGGIEIAEGFVATVSENYIGRSSEFGSGEHFIDIGTVSGNVTVID